jgi:hypothetical protein
MPDPEEVMERRNRVAEWTVEVMAQQLKVMVEARAIRGVVPDPWPALEELEQKSLNSEAGRTVIDEVAEFIILPDYKKTTAAPESPKKTRKSVSCNDLKEDGLKQVAVDELRNYVQTVASLYNPNPFHNFDHANHVVLSVNKLLARINTPDLDKGTGEKLHDNTYGITSDPLTSFACLFSALIHDVDHSGVPNAQLVKEGANVAALYNDKSVAEQNSFDIAWDLLMEQQYKNLRQAIYVNTQEFRRFRQLVINSVMATDIVDKDLKALRNKRWENAFAYKEGQGTNWKTSVRTKILKSTIVIEHLIQASDVAHTMQHWQIYRRWNEKFFRECYKAYLDGRSDSNPIDTWYKGEIGFFDFYIIPLAKKLKECGVFGVSSDEYLSYAMQNRKEWEDRGEKMVEEMVERFERSSRTRQNRKSIAIPRMSFESPTPRNNRRGSDEVPRVSITGGNKAALIRTLQNLMDDDDDDDDDDRR